VKIFTLFKKPELKHPHGKITTRSTLQSQSEDTFKKIDAIECEMSAEFDASFSLAQQHSAQQQAQQLAEDNSFPHQIEEAAVLYASGQEQAAKVLLQHLTTQETTSRFQEQLVWWMLLDLLRIQSAHQEFEQLSVQYAVRFETSPPQWTPPHANKKTDQTLSARVHFRGKLSAENHAAFDPCRKINATHKKIEFALDGISEIDDSGCETLLNFLLQWQAQACAINLISADNLIKQLHAAVKSTPPLACHSTWLLLIEVIRLLNDEFEYEEVCMSYSLTFEVSPPPYVAPVGNLIPASTVEFLLPSIIEMPLQALIENITKHAQNQATLLLDCSALVRVSFQAAAPFVEALSALGTHKTVELRNANFLVSVLLKLIGSNSQLSIFTHRL
jgi:ABC-type transporter Mla MlaB component